MMWKWHHLASKEDHGNKDQSAKSKAMVEVDGF